MNNRNKYPKNWEQIRLVILLRDQFCCCLCGIHQSNIVNSKGKFASLHVMHLDGNSFNNVFVLNGNVFNNSDNNLASGCPTCHRIYDRQFGYDHWVNKKQNHQIVDMSMLQIKSK